MPGVSLVRRVVFGIDKDAPENDRVARSCIVGLYVVLVGTAVSLIQGCPCAHAGAST